jgi:transposase InsO family protein
MSRRQRDDMVILAHIREQHRLSLQSYGRPRMTEELQELGLKVGHRRVGRLMGENGIGEFHVQTASPSGPNAFALQTLPRPWV